MGNFLSPNDSDSQEPRCVSFFEFLDAGDDEVDIGDGVVGNVAGVGNGFDLLKFLNNVLNKLDFRSVTTVGNFLRIGPSINIYFCLA